MFSSLHQEMKKNSISIIDNQCILLKYIGIVNNDSLFWNLILPKLTIFPILPIFANIVEIVNIAKFTKIENDQNFQYCQYCQTRQHWQNPQMFTKSHKCVPNSTKVYQNSTVFNLTPSVIDWYTSIVKNAKITKYYQKVWKGAKRQIKVDMVCRKYWQMA